MCSVRKLSLAAFVSILAVLFMIQFSLAATHIFRPEDHSVYIDQRDPDINKVDKSGILTASALGENARIVIHFDLGGWSPAVESISEAKLHLYHYRGGNYTGSRAINVHPLACAFNESTATWNFPWTDPGGDYDASISASADVPEEWNNWVEWDVTDLLKNRWSNITNYGFLIKDVVEDASGDGPYVRFHSHRADSLPYLEVTTTEQEIPTLTEWGLIIFGLVLMGFVTWVFFRRRPAALDPR
jgi:cbb3-type cytochrome oxidase subunit 3